MTAPAKELILPICHVIKGEARFGEDNVHGRGVTRFSTPAINVDELVWSRETPGPAFDTPLDEIIDILVETGDWITRDPDGLIKQAFELSVQSNSLPRNVLAWSFANLGKVFTRKGLEFQINMELGGKDVVDGWREITDTPSGRLHRIRAFPPRMVHIIAGNAPGVAAMTVAWGALTKGVHLLKIPSNDLFSATAILRGLSAVAPGHPVSQSFSAVYWRGGDVQMESLLYRPQFFDKLAAWGGEGTIRGARQYIGPGFELVAFDPKTSISMIGREIFATDEMLADAAERAAVDVTLMNQQACASSRIQFVEGSVEEVDRYCALLQARMGVERDTNSADGPPLSGELREELEGLRDMEPYYRIWGSDNGRGIVIRSDEPVEFYPDGKVVNVVQVENLADAVCNANVATQTVGVFPPERKAGLRNALASAGVQRVVNLGAAGGVEPGLPHDGFNPLQRFFRWVNDEG